MALIMKMTEGAGKELAPTRPGSQCRCSNPLCITNRETIHPGSFRKSGDMLVCDFCDERTLLS